MENMQVGNARYLKPSDLPETVAVFPLSGALLLPGAQLPLNIFEPRYLAMFDMAIAGNRLIGMVQPAMGEPAESTNLSHVGCLGRITSISETGDGRYIVSLTGICRFRLMEEVTGHQPYRTFRITPFISDLKSRDEEDTVDRAALLAAFRAYLDADNLEADWDSVERADNMMLVNSLSIMAPFDPAEKQALLEAPDLKTRAETFIAIVKIVLAGSGDTDPIMQ
ncbi:MULTISPECIES: LON peptidase substrate-binding domain-containing protein [unclassified Rhizobium]|uniref:LON peptidase substrate-binding domain-containing protein n=1 Tax=unclassified Rhizobium TaxID=2613769 RepID=UPI0018E9E789|nr:MULTISPECIES: LON peptidase substrate-binding domain-containing protein [unclassified Rhizobium]